MNFRMATAALATAVFALGGIAADNAEEPADHLVDIAGDANFLNGQGFAPGMQQSTAPLSMPGADLQGIRFETILNGAIVDGLRVHVRMDQPADAPGPNVVIRTVANINGCPTMISANTGFSGISGYWRLTDAAACGNPAEDYSALGTADYTEGVLVEASETGFIVTLSFTEGLPTWAKSFLKDGAVISEVDAHVRTVLGAPGTGTPGATVPVVDELLDPEFTSWKIGSDG